MKTNRQKLTLLIFLLLSLAFASNAMASPKVHLTGPAKEKAQYVGIPFKIGVSASGFSTGWVEVQAPSATHVLPMERKKRNYLEYTPDECGEHTITAIVNTKDSTRIWESSITITVYPVSAQNRASWMVSTALSCVGSTNVEMFVEGSGISINDDWCAVFIGWCSKQVHIPFGAGFQAIFAGVDLSNGAHADAISCDACRATHKARFSATVLDSEDSVQPGDLVFFIWPSKEESQLKAHIGYKQSWHGNASHVGLIVEVWEGGFSFVHGNIRQPHNLFGVALNLSTDEKEGATYADHVVAFARPNYGYQQEP